MSTKIEYSVVRVPYDDWDNIMETLTLDGGYSEEIKNEVWTAIENMESFSDPWVVVALNRKSGSAKIFCNEKSARSYAKRVEKKLAKSAQILCVKAEYISNLKLVRPITKRVIESARVFQDGKELHAVR